MILNLWMLKNQPLQIDLGPWSTQSCQKSWPSCQKSWNFVSFFRDEYRQKGENTDKRQIFYSCRRKIAHEMEEINRRCSSSSGLCRFIFQLRWAFQNLWTLIYQPFQIDGRWGIRPLQIYFSITMGLPKSLNVDISAFSNRWTLRNSASADLFFNYDWPSRTNLLLEDDRDECITPRVCHKSDWLSAIAFDAESVSQKWLTLSDCFRFCLYLFLRENFNWHSFSF